jgi:hypothetical protein
MMASAYLEHAGHHLCLQPGAASHSLVITGEEVVTANRVQHGPLPGQLDSFHPLLAKQLARGEPTKASIKH